MNLNLKHYFFASQAVYKDMKEIGKGTIVNIGSFSWMLAQGGCLVILLPNQVSWG